MVVPAAPAELWVGLGGLDERDAKSSSVDAEIGETLKGVHGERGGRVEKGRMCGLKTTSCVRHRSLTHYSLYRVHHVVHYIGNNRA